MIGRRSFLGQLGTGAALAQSRSGTTDPARVDVLRPPDVVSLHSAAGNMPLARTAGVEVKAEPRRAPGGWEVPIVVAAPDTALEHVCLRWRGSMSPDWRYLGDHWERSYGDLEWRASVPDRLMPWYFAIADGRSAHGYGVKTGANSICFWQADAEGVSLWLDLRNGGSGVRLGPRRLEAAVVRATPPRAGRSAFATVRELCRTLCDRPRLAAAPIYGGNNWYYTYGVNFGPAEILRDSEILTDAAPADEKNRPFMVIDMGWNPSPGGAGPNTRGGERFGDMAGLAAGMRARGVRPGIWIRPLYTSAKLPDGWRLRGKEVGGLSTIDPSVSEALAQVSREVRLLREWGYELIKHDYSTYDILGRWGFQMGARLTDAGWGFADGSRTTAEIVLAFYRKLREAAGDGLLLGCNTVGHLGAGLFEAQRIGDDTSGEEWERTRKMGVNTLAFRLPQHNTFFAADPDCVPITSFVPWGMTRQWLDLVARSGTPLFVSADPSALGAQQKAALKTAFAAASRPQDGAEPLDWFESTSPERWRLGGAEAAYRWCGDEGASPFAG